MYSLHRCFSYARGRLLAIALGTLLPAFLAYAHAIVKESSPKPGSVIHGPEVTIRLKFNSRIDVAHSRVSLRGPSGALPVNIDQTAPPDTLLAKATGVKPGEYHIQWQVLATDGHITRGDVPFTVQ